MIILRVNNWIIWLKETYKPPQLIGPTRWSWNIWSKPYISVTFPLKSYYTKIMRYPKIIVLLNLYNHKFRKNCIFFFKASLTSLIKLSIIMLISMFGMKLEYWKCNNVCNVSMIQKKLNILEHVIFYSPLTPPPSAVIARLMSNKKYPPPSPAVLWIVNVRKRKPR